METLKHLSGKQKFIAGVAIGLIIGSAGAYFILDQASWSTSKCATGESVADCLERLQQSSNMGNGTKTVTDKSIKDGGTQDESAISGTEGVSVDDQPAGFKVVVNMVTFAKTGWLVVHEDSGGVPGKILGARRYDAGIFLGEVELLRQTEVGKTYYAMLHTDDGDKQFDSKVDLPILGLDARVIMDSFKAQ